MNKYQEALDYYAQLIRLIFNGEKTAYDESFDTLKESVDKAIPKKVLRNITKETKDTEYICPNCKSLVMKVGICNYIDNYCSHCGQALDWSEFYE